MTPKILIIKNTNKMAFNMEKLAKMAKLRSKTAIESAQYRKENREWLRMSQEIALSLHYYLRNNNIKQKELANKMDVSPVYINKLLKGTENLTLETICKIQKVLDIRLIEIVKPYITKQIVKLPIQKQFSPNAVSCMMSYKVQTTKDKFAPIVDNVA